MLWEGGNRTSSPSVHMESTSKRPGSGDGRRAGQGAAVHDGTSPHGSTVHGIHGPSPQDPMPDGTEGDSRGGAKGTPALVGAGPMGSERSPQVWIAAPAAKPRKRSLRGPPAAHREHEVHFETGTISPRHERILLPPLGAPQEAYSGTWKDPTDQWKKVGSRAGSVHSMDREERDPVQPKRRRERGWGRG